MHLDIELVFLAFLRSHLIVDFHFLMLDLTKIQTMVLNTNHIFTYRVTEGFLTYVLTCYLLSEIRGKTLKTDENKLSPSGTMRIHDFSLLLVIAAN